MPESTNPFLNITPGRQWSNPLYQASGLSMIRAEFQIPSENTCLLYETASSSSSSLVTGRTYFFTAPFSNVAINANRSVSSLGNDETEMILGMSLNVSSLICSSLWTNTVPGSSNACTCRREIFLFSSTLKSNHP